MISLVYLFQRVSTDNDKKLACTHNLENEAVQQVGEGGGKQAKVQRSLIELLLCYFDQ
jgi:hypothetical protein